MACVDAIAAAVRSLLIKRRRDVVTKFSAPTLAEACMGCVQVGRSTNKHCPIWPNCPAVPATARKGLKKEKQIKRDHFLCV